MVGEKRRKIYEKLLSISVKSIKEGMKRQTKTHDAIKVNDVSSPQHIKTYIHIDLFICHDNFAPFPSRLWLLC